MNEDCGNAKETAKMHTCDEKNANELVLKIIAECIFIKIVLGESGDEIKAHGTFIISDKSIER